MYFTKIKLLRMKKQTLGGVYEKKPGIREVDTQFNDIGDHSKVCTNVL